MRSRWTRNSLPPDLKFLPPDLKFLLVRYALGMGRVAVVGVLAWLVAATSVGAQVFDAPAIGGPAAAFSQVLGGANEASIGAQLHFQRCAGTDIDQYVILAPNDQVWSIQRQSCFLAVAGPEQRFAEAARFLPSDAVPGEPFTTEFGESALSYQSATLGSTLPAGLFHDCTGIAVPLGTVFVVADAYGGWFMGPGTCP